MSDAEEALATLIRWEKLPEPEREYRFAAPRRWRFDFCWPQKWLAVEVEGGTFVQGRHSRGTGFENDCEKQNEAVIRGWGILRVTPKHIESGEAIAWIRRALAV